MSRILVSGVASARKSSTPASWAIAGAVRGLSPVIMTVRMPMARKRAKRSLMPLLTTSFRWMMPSTRVAVGDRERRAARVADALRRSRRAPRGTEPPSDVDVLDASRRPRPCGSARPVRDRTPLMRVCAENGMKCAPSSWTVAAAQAVLLLDQHDDRAALGRLVGEAGELRGVGELLERARRRPGCSSVAMRLPSVIVPVLSSSSTSTSPAASTARPLIAMTFLRSRRSMPAMPIADSRPPMVVGMRQTSSATMTVADRWMPE